MNGSQVTPLVVAQAAYRIADDLANAAQTLENQSLACKSGCNWCCYSAVEVTIPEALAVYQYVVTNLDRETTEKLSVQIIETDRRTRGMDKKVRAQSRIACPFLGDQGCRVYNVRPIVCRGWNSLDARSCKAAYLGEVAESEIPINNLQYIAIKKLSRDLAYALSETYQHTGILFDLTGVITTFLLHPIMIEEWFSYHAAFSEAIIE